MIHIGGVDIETIEELASQNMAPSDIALSLSVDKRGFLHLWKDNKSDVRNAYERGKLQAKCDIEKKLYDDALTGNMTAIQIHDKKRQEQEFEDIKQSIFSYD